MSKEDKYSLKDLQKDFPTDEVCLDFIFNTLHSKKCSCGGTYKVLKKRKQYQCSKCRYQISPTAGTIFHKSRTPLTLWFHAIWIFSNAKSGISAAEMERQLGVTNKCAWRILNTIRKALPQDTTKLQGEVEIDSTFFGGRGYTGKERKNAYKVWARKPIITVAVERGGRMKAEVMDKINGDSIEDFMLRNVEPQGTTIFSDKAGVYLRTDKAYKRRFVVHSKGEYSKDGVHINTIESFFGHLKRSVRGTFKTLSRRHLQSYLDSFVFHYNTRHNDSQRFGVLLQTLLNA